MTMIYGYSWKQVLEGFKHLNLYIKSFICFFLFAGWLMMRSFSKSELFILISRWILNKAVRMLLYTVFDPSIHEHKHGFIEKRQNKNYENK